MRTAVDTNIISALWSNESDASAIARDLQRAKEAGAVLISGVVYAELLAYPGATESVLRTFLSQTGIEVDFLLRDQTWVEAGRRFAKYASRRRRAKIGGPRRLLADFIVGAHALLQADRLLTLDTQRYKMDFPELRL